MADSNSSGLWILFGALGLGGLVAILLSKKKTTTTSSCSSCSKR